MQSELWPIERDRHYPPIPPETIGPLRDGELKLHLTEFTESRPKDRWAAAYTFDMIDARNGRRVGRIGLRLADTEELLFHGGQIGYEVDPAFRGQRFAARSVRLLLPLARRTGMTELWITCEPQNAASRRTIEIAGGELVEIRPLLPTSPLYSRGERLACRYRFEL